MPSARDCVPRPRSSISVSGPYATSSDWTIPISSGDSCGWTADGALLFASRVALPHPMRGRAATPTLATAAAAVLLTVALGGCGGSKSATSLPSAAPTTPSAAATTAPTAPQPPTGGPVPRGFNPVSFTAISADQFWLLGDAPCSTAVCTSIVRTSDGGKHFVGIPAPRVPLTNSNDETGSIDTLRFASPLVGYAFNSQSFRSAGTPSGPIWETTDGGAHWQRLAVQGVLAFATGGGYLYLVAGSCRSGVCHDPALRRAALGTTDWSSTPLPVGGVDAIVLLAVHGTSVWLSVSPTSGVHPNQVLLTSTDGGASFTTGKSPCTNGLGGDLEAASTSVLWAVCPTGMLAGALRSTDGGATWATLNFGRELSNGARIAPADASTAVISTGDQTQLLRTTDRGGTFTQVYRPRAGWWNFIGFTDAQTGSGIRIVAGQARSSLGTPLADLMRSSDGGASWAMTNVG